MAKPENASTLEKDGLVGIVGGTFDPIHLGHLLLAEEARQQLSLRQVVWLPAATAPHVELKQATTPSHRLEMVKLATAGNSGFAVDDRELRRGGNSYTVDTLTELHREFPGREWVFLMGADSLNGFHQWREPQRICELARIVVVARGGVEPPDLDLLGHFLPHRASPAELRANHFLAMPQLEISSTDIRRRVAEGRSIRYMVHPAVEAYIETNQLYRN